MSRLAYPLPPPLSRGPSFQTPAAGAPSSTTPAASRIPPSSPPPPPRSHVVSRRQALIRLDADGQFRLVNMGRVTVWVNGTMVGDERREGERKEGREIGKWRLLGARLHPPS